MNEVVKTILERRSVRKFDQHPVEEAIVREIIECGRSAPNAWGHQTFEFYAITDRKLMRELAELTAKFLGGEPEDHLFFSAPLIILISDIRDNYMRLADAGCAMENMFLAARSQGVGSVWINQFSPICDKLEVIDKFESIGIAKNRVVTSLGAFGYPAEEPKPKELISAVHYIRSEAEA